MNKKLKKALKEEFAAPAPVDKWNFLRSIEEKGTEPIGNWGFICTQTAYIRKWVWGVSLLIFVISLAGAVCMEKDLLWCICAFMPVLALTVAAESGRSKLYGMAELELASRFSLRSILLARLGVLGMGNLALVLLLAPLAFQNSGVSLGRASVYMLCPYLLTVSGGLWIVRRVRGKEAVYLCAGMAAAVSIGSTVSHQIFHTFYQERTFFWWLAALLVFAYGTLRQCFQLVKEAEELAWN